jgi:hypothetical protein
MLRVCVIIACFVLGAVSLSALREEQATSAEQSSASIPLQDCDRLAGVVFEKIDGKAAQEACDRAIREFPGEVRFKAFLAVALERLNRLAEARAVLRQAAGQSNAVAQYYLGDLYAFGRGVPQSDMEAVKWYHLSADQGFAIAQNDLGFMYAHGSGVPQDYTEAVKWYHLAADKGDASSQANLGIMYGVGHGVPQNYTEAVKWFRLARRTKGLLPRKRRMATVAAQGSNHGSHGDPVISQRVNVKRHKSAMRIALTSTAGCRFLRPDHQASGHRMRPLATSQATRPAKPRNHA